MVRGNFHRPKGNPPGAGAIMMSGAEKRISVIGFARRMGWLRQQREKRKKKITGVPGVSGI